MWRFALARATGTSHIRHDLPCQDRCACVVLPNGTLIAALADGAGSADHGDQGADVIVNTVIASLSPNNIDANTQLADLIRVAAKNARGAVEILANQQNCDIRRFAATLLVVISTEHGSAAAQIGDGVIVVNQREVDWGWVFWPQRGEYANTTRFLTDQDALESLQVETFSKTFDDVVLTSDGLEPLVLNYASKTVHTPFFSCMLAPLLNSNIPSCDEALCSALEKFLKSPSVTDRADDDVSIILATRRTNL